MSQCENESESAAMLNWLTKVIVATAALAAVALLANSGPVNAAQAGTDAQSLIHAAMLFALPGIPSISRIRPRKGQWRFGSEPSPLRRVRATSKLHDVHARDDEAKAG